MNYLATITIENEFKYHNHELTIKLPFSKSTKPLILSIDTGAQISIWKPDKLLKDEKLNTNEKITISGVTEGTKLQTLGSLDTKIKFGNFNIPFKFHILNSGLQLKTDGLIGADFLKTFNAQMDFSNNTLKLQVRTDSFGKVFYNSSNQLSLFDSFLGMLESNTTEAPKNANLYGGRKSKKNPNFYNQLSDEYFEAKKFSTIKATKIDNQSLSDIQGEYKILVFLLRDEDGERPIEFSVAGSTKYNRDIIPMSWKS